MEVIHISFKRYIVFQCELLNQWYIGFDTSSCLVSSRTCSLREFTVLSFLLWICFNACRWSRSACIKLPFSLAIYAKFNISWFWSLELTSWSFSNIIWSFWTMVALKSDIWSLAAPLRELDWVARGFFVKTLGIEMEVWASRFNFIFSSGLKDAVHVRQKTVLFAS